jgi:hypothetical protein
MLTFNISRLMRLMRADIKLHIGWIRIAIVAILLGPSYFVSQLSQPVGFDAYPLSFALISTLLSLRLWNPLHDPRRAAALLLLPCHTIERFLSKWLLVMLVFPAAMFGLFAVASALAATVISFAFHAPWHTVIASDGLPNLFLLYVACQAILMLGLLTFKKAAFLKTILSMVGLAGGYALSLLLVGYGLFGLVVHKTLCLSSTMSAWLPPYTQYLVYAFLLVFCSYVAYLKLTEYEIR